MALNTIAIPSKKPLSPLFKMAVLAGAQVAVKLHIRRGYNVNATDDKGRSPLILATSKGHTDVCRILLEAGADPWVFDNEGNDALSLALDSGKLELSMLLSEYLNLEQTLKVHQNKPPVTEPQSIVNVDGENPDENEFYHENVGTSDINITHFATPEEDDFDLHSWEVDEETQLSIADNDLIDKVTEVQIGISIHNPIDTGEDWSHVVVDIPSVQRSKSASRVYKSFTPGVLGILNSSSPSSNN